MLFRIVAQEMEIVQLYAASPTVVFCGSTGVGMPSGTGSVWYWSCPVSGSMTMPLSSGSAADLKLETRNNFRHRPILSFGIFCFPQVTDRLLSSKIKQRHKMKDKIAVMGEPNGETPVGSVSERDRRPKSCQRRRREEQWNTAVPRSMGDNARKRLRDAEGRPGMVKIS